LLPWALLFFGAGALAVAGWHLLYFLTDDAFIAFRYVSNRRLGFGYVWNAAPFRPVEGYTSFLWVFLLDVIWSLFGAEPPRAANVLSLLCSLFSVALAVAFLLHLCRQHRAGRLTLPLVIFTLASVVTNRTFLTWTSSGLETALFNAAFNGWVMAAILMVRRPVRWLGWLALAAAVATLTRPDGLLLSLASVVIIGHGLCVRVELRRRRVLWRLSPLLAVPIHLVWRRLTYGEWLPNTYYAKYVGAWPAAGFRYAASFLFEYGYWFWLVAGLLVGGVFVRAWLARVMENRSIPGPVGLVRAVWRQTWVPGLAAVGAVAAHVGYYTVMIGGDHFEYRVYSHLVPLAPLTISLAVLVLRWSPRVAGLFCLLSLVASWPLPWGHWVAARHLETRAETEGLFVPTAEHLPPPLSLYAAPFDRMQQWLIARNVCIRHQEHRAFAQHQLRSLPPRPEGARLLAGEENPVVVGWCVGVPGWVFPHAHVLDAYGLNDYVIARSPVVSHEERRMAHDRRPPRGYLRSFAPNLIVYPDGSLVTRRRKESLTDARIGEIEELFRAGIAAEHQH